MPRKSHPFWRFSLRVYARTGVERACLALQEAGADVNLLLFCCWQGSTGNTLDKASLRQAMQSVAAWQQQVVQALRQARLISKRGYPGVPADMGNSLSKLIAKAELDAEYLEQLVLFQLASAVAQATPTLQAGNIAAQNLICYLDLLDLTVDAPIKQHLQVLSDATVGDRASI